MSIQYNFYVALRDKKTEKLELFPGLTYKSNEDYDEVSDEKEATVRPRSIYYRSGSFMPNDFRDEFYYVDEKMCSKEMVKAFSYDHSWLSSEKSVEFTSDLHYLPLDELYNLNSDYIKRGYFLVQDVERYEKNPEALFNDEIFYDTVSTVAYANMCTKQIKTHKEEDDEGFEYTVHGYEDYMYYAYPDTEGTEYLVHVLKIIMSSYKEMIDYNSAFKDKELVLLYEMC